MRAYTKMVAFVAFLERKESTKKTTESIIQCTKKRLYNLAHGQKKYAREYNRAYNEMLENSH